MHRRTALQVHTGKLARPGIRSAILTAAVLTASIPRAANAQADISTFGNGGTYDPSIYYNVASFQSIAEPFVYTGADGLFNLFFTMAVRPSTSAYAISLRYGNNLSTAVTMQSWLESIITNNGEPGIIGGSSGLNPLSFTHGGTYWIVAENSGVDGGWMYSATANSGFWASGPPFTTWHQGVGYSAAYEVALTPGQEATVTPEPPSVVLLATGVVGLLLIGPARLRGSIGAR